MVKEVANDHVLLPDRGSGCGHQRGRDGGVLRQQQRLQFFSVASKGVHVDELFVAVVQHLSTAYLRTALRVDGAAWPAARDALRRAADPIGHVDSK